LDGGEGNGLKITVPCATTRNVQRKKGAFTLFGHERGIEGVAGVENFITKIMYFRHISAEILPKSFVFICNVVF